MKQEILNKLNLVENHERECKLAIGGFPESIWETYDSMGRAKLEKETIRYIKLKNSLVVTLNNRVTTK